MTKKKLYKATCLSELHELASKPVNFSSPQLVQSTMDGCFKRAMECRNQDEEAAYILLIRYFDCYERLKCLAGNTLKSSLFTSALKKQSLLAMDNLELLHKSLEERYEANRSSQHSDLKLPSPPTSPVSKPKEPKKSATIAPENQSTGWISVGELASEMRKRKNTLLIIDLRPSDQYKKCHINWEQSINFPADDTFTRGTTFSTISSTLSNGPFHTYWIERGSFDRIVLVDEEARSSGTDISVKESLPRSHPLLLMKDALFKWDAANVVKTEPLILSGGMREFLLRYAPLTTNPNHRMEPSKRDTQIHGLNQPATQIEYPDMDATDRDFVEAELKRKREEEEEKNKRKTAAKGATATPLGGEASIDSIVDRSMPPNLYSGKGGIVKHGLGDRNVQSDLPVFSEGSSDWNLEERLRFLRVCKPKQYSISKSKHTTDPVPLQPPKVDRTRKPSTPPHVSSHSSDTLPRSSSRESGLSSGVHPMGANGVHVSASSQELYQPPILPHHASLERPDSESDMYAARLSYEQGQPHSETNSGSSNRSSVIATEYDNTSIIGQLGTRRHHSAITPPSIPVQTFPSCHERPLGLRNLGNTCYMNTVIQSLAHTRALATFFLRCLDRGLTNPSNPLGYGGAVSTQFQRLFTAVWSSSDCSSELIQFKSVVAKHSITFAGSDQQDSLEFLLFLLDGLHEDMNEARKGSRTMTTEEADGEDQEQLNLQTQAAKAWEYHLNTNKSVVVSSFQGQLLSTIQCRCCPKKSWRFDAFMCLSIPLPSSSRCTLQTCMALFGSPEEIEDQWFCPRCRRRTNAVKVLSVWRLPTYLIIHLKRFRFQDGGWKKSTNDVLFPVDNYCPQENKGTYSLYAVINHFGTMESGHYTAFCRSITDGRWYEYDDGVVTEINPSRIQSNAAYILFYERLPRIEVFSKSKGR